MPLLGFELQIMQESGRSLTLQRAQPPESAMYCNWSYVSGKNVHVVVCLSVYSVNTVMLSL